jgi:hypothetical protein
VTESAHESVILTDPGGREVQIDSRIAEMIGLMWDSGIETMESCEQNERGHVEIVFRSVEDVESLLDCIARPGMPLHPLVASDGHPLANPGRGQWVYTVGPAFEDGGSGPEWVFRASAEFPPDQIRFVVEALK